MGNLKVLSAFLVASCVLSAADLDVSKTLKGIEDHYNRVQTLQVNFSLTLIDRRARHTPEKGVLYLHKPGRMRWEYTSPPGKLFVSDGETIYEYNPDENRVTKGKLKDADDLRAPLAFLLGKLNFHDDFGKFEASPQGSDAAITAYPKSDKAPFTEVSFLAAPDFTIKQLSVKGTDGSVMQYVFDGEKKNPPLSDTLFHFKPPAGAQVVDQSNEKQ